MKNSIDLNGRYLSFMHYCVKVILLIGVLSLNKSIIFSQSGMYYDSRTNAFYPGTCGIRQDFNLHEGFVNSNSASQLFDWQMVQTPTIQLIRDINYIDTLHGFITYFEGVMKTENGGINWQEIFYLSGSDPTGVYFLNKDTGWFCGSMKRIRKTINGGQNWIVQDYPQFALPFYTSVKFIDNDVGYITGERDQKGYVIKTTNNGENWIDLFLSTQNDTRINGQYWFNKDTGWVYGNSIFMKTTNGGSSFTDYYSNLPPTTNGQNGLLGLSFINEQTGWISGSNVNNKNMHKTTNGGLSWVFQNNPVTQYQFAQLDDVLFIDENRGWAAAYSGQIIVSTNGGTNWITDLTSPTWFVCFANYGSSKV